MDEEFLVVSFWFQDEGKNDKNDNSKVKIFLQF